MASISTQANGASDPLVLNSGLNKVSIGCADMAVGTTALVQTSSTGFVAGDIHEHPDPKDATAKAMLTDTDTVSTEGSGNEVGREFLLSGPGQIRLWVDSIGASDPITLTVLKSG